MWIPFTISANATAGHTAFIVKVKSAYLSEINKSIHRPRVDTTVIIKEEYI